MAFPLVGAALGLGALLGYKGNKDAASQQQAQFESQQSLGGLPPWAAWAGSKVANVGGALAPRQDQLMPNQSYLTQMWGNPYSPMWGNVRNDPTNPGSTIFYPNATGGQPGANYANATPNYSLMPWQSAIGVTVPGLSPWQQNIFGQAQGMPAQDPLSGLATSGLSGAFGGLAGMGQMNTPTSAAMQGYLGAGSNPFLSLAGSGLLQSGLHPAVTQAMAQLQNVPGMGAVQTGANLLSKTPVMNPQIQQAMGALGSMQPSGYLDRAGQMLNYAGKTQPLNAEATGALQGILGGGTADPYMQTVADNMRQRTRDFWLGNQVRGGAADEMAGAAARRGLTPGMGAALTQQLDAQNRLALDTESQIAQMLSQDFARRQAAQQQGIGQAFAQGAQQANLGLNLGSAFGNLGQLGFGQQLQGAQAGLQAGLLPGQLATDRAQALGQLGSLQGNLGLAGAGALGNLGLNAGSQDLARLSQLGGIGQAQGGLNLSALSGLAGLGQNLTANDLARFGQIGQLGLGAGNLGVTNQNQAWNNLFNQYQMSQGQLLPQQQAMAAVQQAYNQDVSGQRSDLMGAANVLGQFRTGAQTPPIATNNYQAAAQALDPLLNWYMLQQFMKPANTPTPYLGSPGLLNMPGLQTAQGPTTGSGTVSFGRPFGLSL